MMRAFLSGLALGAVMAMSSSAWAGDWREPWPFPGFYGGAYGPATDGYRGRPRFFESWRDRVGGYDDPYDFSDYGPYGAAGILPDNGGLYLDNRGYGTRGGGWQGP